MKMSIGLLLMLLPALALAAEGENGNTRSRSLPADFQDAPATPPEAKEIRKYAEDGQEGPQQNFGVQPIHDNQILGRSP